MYVHVCMSCGGIWACVHKRIHAKLPGFMGGCVKKKKGSCMHWDPREAEQTIWALTNNFDSLAKSQIESPKATYTSEKGTSRFLGQ
jgi:hypothetical protein